MAKSDTSANPPKKQRWYHNLRDAYRIAKRTYPFIAWLVPLILVGLPVLGVALGWLVNSSIGYAIYWGVLGLLTGAVAAMAVLSIFARRAAFTQLEGMQGAVSAVLEQIRRGWSIESQPATVAPKTQDIVWRAVGAPGVVLISEGPAARVERLLEDEAKKVRRVAPNVPVHLLQSGRQEGQVPLAKLMRTMSGLTRQTPRKQRLTKAEIPAVAKRLRALQSKTGLPVPKGVDPFRARPDRKGMRGR